MKFIDILNQRKDVFVAEWFKQTIETYPDKAFKYFSDDKKQFANPVGYIISNELTRLYDELLQMEYSSNLTEILDNIIRIRAVQDFTPSQALSFFYVLKDILKKDLGDSLSDKSILNDYLMFCRKIDDLMGKAFDRFMEAREKLWEIKTNELKARTYVLLEKIGKKQNSIEN